MIEIAEVLRSEPSLLWKLVKQAGVNYAVGGLTADSDGAERPWDFMPLLRTKTRLEDAA